MVVVSAQVGIIVGPMNLAGSFKTYALYATLLNNVGQALGMLIGCTFKSKEVAMQVRHTSLDLASNPPPEPVPENRFSRTEASTLLVTRITPQPRSLRKPERGAARHVPQPWQQRDSRPGPTHPHVTCACAGVLLPPQPHSAA